MSFSQDQLAELNASLDGGRVATREQGKTKLSYIEGWWAIAEANRIFGHDNWTRETVDLRRVSERERKVGKGDYQRDGWGVSYVARVKIVVFAGDTLVTREGIGAGHGIDADLGSAHESAVKEAETDAMKRALSTFGWPFGLALYDKTREHVAHNGDGGKVRNPKTGRLVDPKSSRQAKARGDWPAFEHELSECETVVKLAALRREYQESVYPTWSQTWQEQAEEAFEKRQAELTAADLPGTLEDSLEQEEAPSPAPQSKADYVQFCHEQIENAPDKTALKAWWDGEKFDRRRFGLTQKQCDDLKARVSDRVNELDAELLGAG